MVHLPDLLPGPSSCQPPKGLMGQYRSSASRQVLSASQASNVLIQGGFDNHVTIFLPPRRFEDNFGF